MKPLSRLMHCARRLPRRRHAFWLASFALTACATYHPLPLDTHLASPYTLASLRGATAIIGPLSMGDVERLVLLNNPDLRNARIQHRVAQAQLLQAGLLPNPMFNGDAGYLISGVGDATAWTAGLSEDIASLITLAPRRRAAKASAAQIDASLLWQEWQTLAKARLLVVDLTEGERQRAVLQATLSLLGTESKRVKQSLDDGNTELASTSPVMASAADAQARLDDLQRNLLSYRHDLAAMLGLPPDTNIPLAAPTEISMLDTQAVREAMQGFEHQRPDLIALQLGYDAQDANLRAAILAQFPSLAFGYAGSQDNSRVRNGGPSISFSLPIFDHNQGNIAIATATRQQLHDEYAQRIVAARNEVLALLSAQEQLRAQLDEQRPQSKAASQAAAFAEAAFREGNLDIRTEADLEVAALTRQSSVLTLEQSLLDQQVAMTALLGTGLPHSLPKDVIAP